MSIQQYLDKIKNAVYGREVRGAIHDAIKQTYDDASEGGDANMEVKMARGAFPNLNARLDNQGDKIRANSSQLAKTATKEELNETENKIRTDLSNIADGSPKGTYSTLTELQSAFPTGTTGIFVVSADGNWYYWNGVAWTSGGVYQSTGLSEDVTSKLSELDKSPFIPSELNLDLMTKSTGHSGSSFPATTARLWGSLNIPINEKGKVAFRIKAKKQVTENAVLLQKINDTQYNVVQKEQVNIPSGINVITTNLEVKTEGEYYLAITDSVVNFDNGVGSFYYQSSSLGVLLQVHDFDHETDDNIVIETSSAIIQSSFRLGLEVWVYKSNVINNVNELFVKTSTLEEKLNNIEQVEAEKIPKDVIYTEKFINTPNPPYGEWVEVGERGTFLNGYSPIPNSEFANYFYLNQVTNFDTDTVKWRVLINDVTSKFRLARIGMLNIKTTTVEFDNGVIRIFKAANKFAFNTPTHVLTSKTLTMPIVAGREYIFTLENFGFIIKFEVIDTVTGESEYIEWNNMGNVTAGLCMDHPLISLASGDIVVKQFDYFTKYKRSPKVVIIGDSIVEGMTIQDDGHEARWAHKVYNALNGDCAILGVGSETTSSFIPKLPVLERTFYRPEYVLLELMTNDTNFAIWKANTEKLIDWVESVGAIPVICMMPRTKIPLDLYNSILNFVENRGYQTIWFNRALTVNGDGVTNNTNYYLADQVHPNATGHDRMFKQVQADLGGVFPLAY